MKRLWFSFIAITTALVYFVLTLNYNEDISEFLPIGTSDREALSVYQNVSGANRLIILFDNPDDEDRTIEAIDCFAENFENSIVQQTKELTNSKTQKLKNSNEELKNSTLTTQFDIDIIMEVTDFVYENMPYFLTEADYVRMDSLLSMPNYPAEQMARNREMLMLPSGGMLMNSLAHDPLGMFAPVMSDMKNANPQMSFEMYDGHIFTADMSRAIAMLTSPYGNSETSNNQRLLSMLDASIDSMHTQYPDIKAHVVGGPAIAVGNASQIKTDSIIAIGLSAILIILLLACSFQSLRNIMLIILSISWGWIFALGGMAMFREGVSIIVIGISSVILGIAINYPLHLIAHTAHEPDIRRAIKDITMPLVVGNITTVGAFLALVPLQSIALRDLGIFASLLLVGTIIFVLVYLPHLIKVKQATHTDKDVMDKPDNSKIQAILTKLSHFKPEEHKPIVWGSALLTIVFAAFSLNVEFDANLANINYMTKEQREDMEYFQQLLSKDSTNTSTTVYLLSKGKTLNEALDCNLNQQETIDSLVALGLVTSHHGVARFVVSESEQAHRLALWNEFVQRHVDVFSIELPKVASACGFSSTAFAPFVDMIAESTTMEPQDIEHFAPLTELMFSQNITYVKDLEQHYIVETLNVPSDRLHEVKGHFAHCFDVVSMNSALANNLSDNFNYIGWACSLIVFFFLWFSFRRIELAIISFIPMAVSWLWILGIMAILGIKFNIVNIILATFIFGQGDDYTIFMTEGCQYEYTHHRPILASYKSSIIQSAIIMFIGIGTLIVAQHPAMRSLAEVTIVGMLSVVFMAYMIPPLLFRMLTTKDGKPRPHPITLMSIITGKPSNPDYYKLR